MAKYKEKPQAWGREPWEVRIITHATDAANFASAVRHLCIFDADGKLVITIATVKMQEDFSERDKSNAERIVASVNWCEQ